MSRDGFIADANHGGFDDLFKWYGAGDVELPTSHPDLRVKVSAASAEHLRRLNQRLGALVCGRRLYDMTNAWGGRSPLDLTAVVVTHQRPENRPEDNENLVFVTTGIEDAVARAEEQSDRPAHASFMDSLLDAGFVILGGPLADEHRLWCSSARPAQTPWHARARSVERAAPPREDGRPVDIRLHGRARLAEARLGTADVSSAVAPSQLGWLRRRQPAGQREGVHEGGAGQVGARQQ